MKVTNENVKKIIQKIRNLPNSTTAKDHYQQEIINDILLFFNLPKNLANFKVATMCENAFNEKILHILVYPFDSIALEEDRKFLLANRKLQNLIDKNKDLKSLISDCLVSDFKQMIQNSEMPNDHYSKKSHLTFSFALAAASISFLANVFSKNSNLDNKISGIVSKILLSASFLALAINNFVIYLAREDNPSQEQLDLKIEKILLTKKLQIRQLINALDSYTPPNSPIVGSNSSSPTEQVEKTLNPELILSR